MTLTEKEIMYSKEAVYYSARVCSLWSQTVWVYFLALPLSSYVIVDKLFNLVVPVSSYVK